MKTSKKMAAILASMMMLSACGSQATNNSGNLATLDPDINIQADEAYETLINNNQGKSTVFQYIVEQLVKSKYAITDAMNTEADLTIENIQTSYKNYYGASGWEDALNSALIAAGFTGLEDYRSTLIYSFQLKECLTQYRDAHLDEVFEDYFTLKNPRYVSHILVMMTDPENPTEEEAAKLAEVTEKIQAGEDFAELAKQYSDDGSASQGGALGLVDVDTNFVTEFLKTALELEPGVISEPVKTQYGYHFILVTSQDKAELKADEDVLEALLTYDDYMIYLALGDIDLTFDDETIETIFNDSLESSINARKAARGE